MEKAVFETNETTTSKTPEQGAPVDRPASVERELTTDAEIDSAAKRAFEGRQERRKILEKETELGMDSFGTKKPVEGNFKGDWTLALYKRLKHPAMKEKLLALRWPVFNGTLPYKIENFADKDIYTKKFYYDRIRNFDRDVDAALSRTTYVSAADMGHNPEALGSALENGTVFRDATLKGRPQYLRNPDELIERMSQLKNYFGFEGDEVFTRAHLAYAREHYLQDGAIDNSMTDFFAMITSDKEDEFLRIINEYPV